MWLCRNTPSGISEFREFWEEMFATPPVEFRNSGNYGNFGKRCYITGPSGIPEFRELCEFREEMSYHWALWNSGFPGILGRDVLLQGSLEFWNSRKFWNSGKRGKKTKMKYKLPMLIKIIAQWGKIIDRDKYIWNANFNEESHKKPFWTRDEFLRTSLKARTNTFVRVKKKQ